MLVNNREVGLPVSKRLYAEPSYDLNGDLHLTVMRREPDNSFRAISADELQAERKRFLTRRAEFAARALRVGFSTLGGNLEVSVLTVTDHRGTFPEAYVLRDRKQPNPYYFRMYDEMEFRFCLRAAIEGEFSSLVDPGESYDAHLLAMAPQGAA